MEFRFSADVEAFREEVRSFLATELPAGWRDPGADEIVNDDVAWDFQIAFLRKLGRQGWIAPHWPKEYGGGGMTVMEQLAFNEEMAYRGAPTSIGPGTGMVGPILILYGTDAQKRQHLPGITSVNTIWCQGYSEPGSGSDLASLQTRAVREGDDYVINGQKIWTSFATRAGWMFMLARTNPEAPKHRGISAFLLDMKSPGVTVSPLTILSGQSGMINQVFFDNVRVPKENLVGEENRGWYVGATLLDFERSNIAGAARAQRELEDFVAYCKETRDTDGLRLIDHQNVRHELADFAIAIRAGKYLCYRVASMQAKGQIPNMEASVSKLYFSELTQRFANTKVNLMGLHGLLRPESARWARLQGRTVMAYMRSIPNTIAGGSSEIQRNVIATRGLGLPR